VFESKEINQYLSKMNPDEDIEMSKGSPEAKKTNRTGPFPFIVPTLPSTPVAGNPAMPNLGHILATTSPMLHSYFIHFIPHQLLLSRVGHHH
jgi:hypothetical protein